MCPIVSFGLHGLENQDEDVPSPAGSRRRVAIVTVKRVKETRINAESSCFFFFKPLSHLLSLPCDAIPLRRRPRQHLWASAEAVTERPQGASTEAIRPCHAADVAVGESSRWRRDSACLPLTLTLLCRPHFIFLAPFSYPGLYFFPRAFLSLRLLVLDNLWLMVSWC